MKEHCLWRTANMPWRTCVAIKQTRFNVLKDVLSLNKRNSVSWRTCVVIKQMQFNVLIRRTYVVVKQKQFSILKDV